MRRTVTLLISVLLISVCLLPGRTSGEEKVQTDNFVEHQKIGISYQMAGNQIVVRALSPNLPADKAGIRAGDVVLTVDGRSFKNINEIISHVGSSRKGGSVVFAVQRNGEPHTYTVETMPGKVRPTIMKMQFLLLDNRKIALAVVVSDVKNTFDMKRDIYDSWVEGVRNDEQTAMESFYLKNLGRYADFSIVDRSRTKALLEEFRLGQSGLVSDTLRQKIGEMTGATHILDVTFARYKTADGRSDALNARLIEIGSGTVLAVDQIKTRYTGNKQSKKP